MAFTDPFQQRQALGLVNPPWGGLRPRSPFQRGLPARAPFLGVSPSAVMPMMGSQLITDGIPNPVRGNGAEMGVTRDSVPFAAEFPGQGSPVAGAFPGQGAPILGAFPGQGGQEEALRQSLRQAILQRILAARAAQQLPAGAQGILQRPAIPPGLQG